MDSIINDIKDYYYTLICKDVRNQTVIEFKSFVSFDDLKIYVKTYIDCTKVKSLRAVDEEQTIFYLEVEDVTTYKNNSFILLGLMFLKEHLFISSSSVNKLSEFKYQTKDSILEYLDSLKIPFQILFDLFDEQYDKWSDGNFDYNVSYFIIDEDTGRIGIYSKPDGSIAYLDEWGDKWNLEEDKSE